MPGGFERLNERRKRPNERISFIKPLDGPDKTTAQDFLERIAAISNPIMKQNCIVITTLEEYEPNREFVGRNFNGGEIIQLVLKAPSSGHWLPFIYVAHVMMHELAHCKQMNHSKAFWKVKNAFSDDLRRIQAQGYTGEGLWSQGVTLASGQFERQIVAGTEIVPEQLCGGTYRSNRKRKSVARPKETYKERQAKRIVRKFGTSGQALGADEEQKVTLEKGKRASGKPRVAGSMRGRELRAAAALARFDTDTERPTQDLAERVAGSDGTETDEDDLGDLERDGARDLDGRLLLDQDGNSMVKVCQGENHDDEDSRRELNELKSYMRMAGSLDRQDRNSKDLSDSLVPPAAKAHNDLEAIRPPPSSRIVKPKRSEAHAAEAHAAGALTSTVQPVSKLFAKKREWCVGKTRAVDTHIQARKVRNCTVCSMENDMSVVACLACGNVLDGLKIASAWECQSEACRDGTYVNAGGRRLCGACGARKSF